jgi:N-acyl-D-amino-acid deacylase
MEFDLVIRDGLVVDGSGTPGVRGDVAVVGDRIVAVGEVDGTGREEIDADGLVVAPGFVDAHTHMDAQLFWDELGTSSCWQGVTTVVMGNCGYTLAPVRPEDRSLVIRNIERAEDISADALAEGVPWTWSTFAEYLDAVDSAPKGINYAGSIGHSALRIWAMGERAYDGPATEDDLLVMERELSDALRAGAMGFSTQRSPLHTTADGRPVASRLASWDDEVVRLVTLMGRESTGAFQSAGYDGRDALSHFQRLQKLALSSGVRQVTPCHDLDLVPMLEETVARGGEMYGLTPCREFRILQSFETRLSFDTLGEGEWSDVRSRPLDEQRKLFEDPDVRARLVHAAHNGHYNPVQPGDPFEPDYEYISTLYSPHLPNPTVAEEARQRGIDPVECMIDIALEHDFRVFFDQLVRTPRDEDVVLKLMANPHIVTSFSDAGAHVSQLDGSSLTTHLLAYWVRERQAMSLERAIAMMTSQPAKMWRLHDRGVLAPGYAADITVFNAETVAPLVPQVVFDLPRGGCRLEQNAQGYVATIVNGRVVTRDGVATEARPGQMLRSGRISVPA